MGTFLTHLAAQKQLAEVADQVNHTHQTNHLRVVTQADATRGRHVESA